VDYSGTAGRIPRGVLELRRGHPNRHLSTGARPGFQVGLFGRPWLEEWSRGRITLLGDAAHPMLPFLGQGAANAIEDAMILARCLTSEAAPERAFALYQRTRGPRARAATEQAAQRGDRYLGEPNAESLKGNEPGQEYAYDAVSGPLGG